MNTQEYISSGIIESYVLGLATAEERAELESNMAKYPEVREAVTAFETQLEKKAMSGSVSAPVHMRERILEAIDNDDITIPKAKIRELRPATSSNSFKTYKYVAAASVILLIVSAALNLYYYNSYKTAETSYRQLLAEQTTLQANINTMQTRLTELDSSMYMMKDPRMAVIKMPGVQGKETNMATVYWNTANKDVYVLQNTLPKAPSGMQYQLWAIVDGKPVDAGMIGDCEALCKMKNIPRAEAFAITLEKQGGSPSPNLSALYVMGKV